MLGIVYIYAQHRLYIRFTLLIYMHDISQTSALTPAAGIKKTIHNPVNGYCERRL